MTQIFSSILSVKINVVAIMIGMLIASLHLKLVAGSSLLQRVEHMQTVVFVKFELSAYFIMAILITIFLIVLKIIIFLS